MDKLKELADLLYDQKVKEGWKNVSMEQCLNRATDYYRIQSLVKESDSLPCVSKSTIKHKIQQGMTDCGWSVLRSFQENESWETAIAHLVKYLEKKGINVGK